MAFIRSKNDGVHSNERGKCDIIYKTILLFEEVQIGYMQSV